MVALAVIGIVSTVAAVNMAKQGPRYRLNSATQAMVWTLRGLRMQALSQHHTITVTFTNNHVYTIWTDTNDNGQIDTGEVQTIDLNRKYMNIQLTTTANPVFNPTGLVTNTAAITLTNTQSSKTISMTASGRIRIN
jgi:type II secretory pathway pseudopilin PulG